MHTDIIKTMSITRWEDAFSHETALDAVAALEHGSILHFPSLPFTLLSSETPFLAPDHVSPKTKNISFHAERGTLSGALGSPDTLHAIRTMLHRFSDNASRLVHTLLSPYAAFLQRGRTSFRPIEIKGRPSSVRKDDTRLHVDAFPSQPIQGKRILRVFTNINPADQDRVWRVGEPFTEVAKRFLPEVSQPWLFAAPLLKALRLTKSRRTEYDHIMLQIHDRMKANDTYQREVSQREVRFAPGHTWIVQTDSVSHAAMRGQHLLEQTFYFPVSAMVNPAASPLRILEKMCGRYLV